MIYSQAMNALTSNPEICNQVKTSGLYATMVENLKNLDRSGLYWVASIVYNVVMNGQQASGHQVSPFTY